MNDAHFALSASIILHHMALERKRRQWLFGRWKISHEPLRNDAANLLRESGWRGLMPEGTQYVGDDAQEDSGHE